MQRNKKIDECLLENDQGKESKEQSFLEAISKIKEKLIYQEHFGYPFYDLFKRLLSTHGDLHPLVQSVKTMHSQAQIFCSILLSDAVFEQLGQQYKTLDLGIRALVEFVFSKECQQFYNFQALYKNLKKETDRQQHYDDDE